MALVKLNTPNNPAQCASVEYGVIRLQVVSAAGVALVASNPSALVSGDSLSGVSAERVYDAVILRAGEPAIELQWAGNVYLSTPDDSAGTGEVVVHVMAVERCK